MSVLGRLSRFGSRGSQQGQLVKPWRPGEFPSRAVHSEALPTHMPVQSSQGLPAEHSAERLGQDKLGSVSLKEDRQAAKKSLVEKADAYQTPSGRTSQSSFCQLQSLPNSHSCATSQAEQTSGTSSQSAHVIPEPQMCLVIGQSRVQQAGADCSCSESLSIEIQPAWAQQAAAQQMDSVLFQCPICCIHLTSMDMSARQHHINLCLDAEPSIDSSSLRPATAKAVTSTAAAKGGIANWLATLGMTKHVRRFQQEQIDPACVSILSNSDLIDLGVTCPKERSQIARAASEICSSKIAARPQGHSIAPAKGLLDSEHSSVSPSGQSSSNNRIVESGLKSRNRVKEISATAGTVKARDDIVVLKADRAPLQSTTQCPRSRYTGHNSGSSVAEQPGQENKSLNNQKAKQGCSRAQCRPPALAPSRWPRTAAGSNASRQSRESSQEVTTTLAGQQRPKLDAPYRCLSDAPVDATLLEGAAVASEPSKMLGKKRQLPSTSGEQDSTGQKLARQKLQCRPVNVMLKPPQSLPGIVKRRHRAASQIAQPIKESSYARSLEATLLTALFGMSENKGCPEEGQLEKCRGRTSCLGHSGLSTSEIARLIDRQESLWACASGTPGCKLQSALLGSSLAARIADNKARRAAAKGALQQHSKPNLESSAAKDLPHRSMTRDCEGKLGVAKEQQDGVLGVNCSRDVCRVGCAAHTDVAEGTTKGLQLEALRTELRAAEETVRELKLLIAELVGDE